MSPQLLASVLQDFTGLCTSSWLQRFMALCVCNATARRSVTKAEAVACHRPMAATLHPCWVVVLLLFVVVPTSSELQCLQTLAMHDDAFTGARNIGKVVGKCIRMP